MHKQPNIAFDTLSWPQVPTCSTFGVSTCTAMRGCALATFVVAMAL